MDNRRRARLVENATNQSDVLCRGEDLPIARERRECTSCGHPLSSRQGLLGDWDAFPAGVKFDPSDEELLQHLKAEIGSGTIKAHPLIGNFISVLDGEDGICQTHPEHLPGVKKDGSSRHFFHRPAKAYTTGTRKRRKIHSDDDELGVETRWHKTGKTRPVFEGGKILGWKKIMVLYRNTGTKKSKPEKTNWILHQYHLGQNEEETDGELVVCKVFYQRQPRQCTGGRQMESIAEIDNVDLNYGSREMSLACVSEVSRGTPATPKVDAPNRPRSVRLPIKEVFPLDTKAKIRGCPAQSSKDSELTVIGMETQAAISSEQTSTPVLQDFQALVSGAANGRIPNGAINAALWRTLAHTLHKDYSPKWSDPGYEEVSTSGKSCHNENDNQAGGIGFFPRECEPHQASQFLGGESQQPYQDDGDFNLSEFLLCHEELGIHSIFSEALVNIEPGSLEEPCISNPNADYPAIDEILMDTPPAINTDLILSSQEVMEVIYQKKPSSTSFDNDDSLSST